MNYLYKRKAQCGGRTLIEVMLVLFLLSALTFFFLLYLGKQQDHASTFCVNNLKQVGLSLLIYAGDNENKYPMSVYQKNGLDIFPSSNCLMLSILAMTNEISNPKVLHCPQDTKRVAASNFASLSEANVSYFLSLDAQGSLKSTILAGDRNLEYLGRPVKSGSFELTTNKNITWTEEMHSRNASARNGYVLLNDGVFLNAKTNLDLLIGQQEIPTNRLSVP